MKRTDFILITAAIIVVAVILLFRNIGRDDDELYVIVNIDNDTVLIHSLDEEYNKQFKAVNGYNTLIISKGYAWIKEADCKNQVCVNSNKINARGESIVCLPHKLSVLIVAKDEVKQYEH